MARRTRNTQQQTRDSIVMSTPIDLTTGFGVRYAKSVIAKSAHEGKSLWDFYKISEVHQGVSRGARTAGYAQIQARRIGPDGKPGKVFTGGMEAESAAMIRSPYGGRRAYHERFYTLQKVPGDAYLIRCRERPDGEGDVVGYDWLSADEIELETSDKPKGGRRDGETVFTPKQKITRITHPRVGGGERLERQVNAEDFLGRVWRPAGQFVDMADSPLGALETECELLRSLTLGIKKRLRGRLAMNGILYVPSEVSEVRQGAPIGKDGEVFHEDKVLDGLIRAATWSLYNADQDLDDPNADLPIFMRGPAQHAEALRFIMGDIALYEVDMKLRAELIGRILVGLDNEPETVKGVGDSNHWGAWAIEDSERRVNIQPVLEDECWANTRLILHADMLRQEAPPGRIARSMIWYDLTEANVKTNLAEDARQAHDRGLTGDAAARRMQGIGEEDAASEVDQIRIFGRKNKVPRLAFHGFKETEKWTDEDWEKVSPSKTGPAPDSNGDDPEANPSDDSGSPNKKPGGKSMAVVRSISQGAAQ